MRRRIMTILVALAIMASLTACGEQKETTLSGMVVSVDGTKITLVEMDASKLGNKDFTQGENPQMPEGMEGFQGFGDFNPEDFNGQMPEGGNFPQRGDGQMPEDFTLPDGFTMPEDGSMPNFGEGMPNVDGNGGAGSGFGNIAADAEKKELDIGDAHISVEIDGGKESGSIASIQAGSFVTITMNSNGKVTNVLVSSQSFLGGNRRPAN